MLNIKHINHNYGVICVRKKARTVPLKFAVRRLFQYDYIFWNGILYFCHFLESKAKIYMHALKLYEFCL